jgi:hypothetical protein
VRIIFEVAGKPAQVIAANPAGITRDGCGFINTPQVTFGYRHIGSESEQSKIFSRSSKAWRAHN